jgi:tetratricopeptide (TPR) repeat protein
MSNGARSFPRLLLLRTLLLLAGHSVALASQPQAAAANPQAAATTTPATLGNAQTLFSAKRFAEADIVIRAVLDGEAFKQESASTQHEAVRLALSIARALKQYDRAAVLAARSTAFKDQEAGDWSSRARAALQNNDPEDAAKSLVVVARRWPYALNGNDGIVNETARAVREQRHADAHRELLEALLDMRWLHGDGTEPSGLWRDLSLELLDKSLVDRAIDVATHVTDPYVLIEMRADRRMAKVMRSGVVHTNVKKAAIDAVAAAKQGMHDHPGSLARVTALTSALMTLQQYQEILDATAPIVERVRTAAPGLKPYEDVERQYEWVLHARARALLEMGRFDDALAEQRLAMSANGPSPSASQAINLAGMLNDLARPAEALAVLPVDANLSPYGFMQLQSMRFESALLMHDDAAAAAALKYLREHEADSPVTLQRMLAISGAADDAARILIARLADPWLRTDALVEAQQYAPGRGPPQALAWRASALALCNRPDVRAAINAVGSVDRYPTIR